MSPAGPAGTVGISLSHAADKVEPNARLAPAFAQHAYVIETGDIVLSGPAKELRENGDVKKAYLGG